MATIKKPVKKAQNGTPIKGNPKGYNPSSSPLKTTPYEKKLDTLGSRVRMFSGKGEKIGDERLGSSGAKKLASNFKSNKAYTEERRGENKDFLESRDKIGKLATKSKMKKGGTVKKMTTYKSGGKVTKK